MRELKVLNCSRMFELREGAPDNICPLRGKFYANYSEWQIPLGFCLAFRVRPDRPNAGLWGVSRVRFPQTQIVSHKGEAA